MRGNRACSSFASKEVEDALASFPAPDLFNYPLLAIFRLQRSSRTFFDSQQALRGLVRRRFHKRLWGDQA
jgi:hypothetical protein